MKIVRSPAAMSRLARTWQRPVALVPTMGALHAGHLSLIDRARKAVGPRGVVAVSIFVNPTQFGPKEDFAKYPRPLQRDLALCRERGVNLVFNPSPAAMYAPDASIRIHETALSEVLCGRSRPGHFAGVCTVVAKLFLLVRPDIAVFGKKDFQQLAIIRRMTRDLNFPVRIIAGETLREPDGLAMSSRNVYLTPEQRAQAPALRAALLSAARLKNVSAARRAQAARKWIERAPLARIDYLECVDADSLVAPEDSLAKQVIAAAVYFGNTRLIDNAGVTVPRKTRQATKPQRAKP